MDDTIKSQVKKCLDAADRIEASGILKDRINTTLRETVRYEMLKFLAALSDGEGSFTDKESRYSFKCCSR